MQLLINFSVSNLCSCVCAIHINIVLNIILITSKEAYFLNYRNPLAFVQSTHTSIPKGQILLAPISSNTHRVLTKNALNNKSG